MILGRVKASAKKEHLGVLALDLGDGPLPEGKRLGVRVVDAEDRHALLDPVEEDAPAAPPTLPASPRSRNRRGKCPGISWADSRRTGSCRRAAGETTTRARRRRGGRAQPGRRYPARLRCRAPGLGDEAVEVVQRAQFGEDRLVSALGRADRPGAAGIVGARRSGIVVAALAEAAADGMNGRQVETLKPISAT